MIIHAKSYEQKKMQAQHIVTGCVCKNCEYYRKGVKGVMDGICQFDKYIKCHTDYCSNFERIEKEK